jgi:hypothetical protein
MNIQTFPVIKTERLTLRKIEESVGDIILFLRSDKSINLLIDLKIEELKIYLMQLNISKN